MSADFLYIWLLKNSSMRLLFFLVLVVQSGFGQTLLHTSDTFRYHVLAEASRYRWASGYALVEFDVDKHGAVERVKVNSTYFIADKDTTKRQTEARDQLFFKRLLFEPTGESYTVQVKIYVYFHNSRRKLPDGQADPMSAFDYGLKQLYEHESRTFFDPESEFIRQGNTLIFKPVYIYKIT
jgi:hypothetical protein